MLPFIHIFGKEIPTFSISIAIGIILSFIILSRRKRDIEVNDSILHYYWLLMLLIFGIGARIAGELLFSSETSEASTTGETSIIGSLVLGVIWTFAYATITKTKTGLLADAIILPMLTLQICGKIGCFLAGCCYGCSTDSVLGIHSYRFAGRLPVHPVQLYEVIFYLILFFLLYRYRDQLKVRVGLSAAIYLLSYSLGRLIFEYYRGDTLRWDYGLTVGQAGALLLILGSLILHLVIFLKPKLPVTPLQGSVNQAA